MLRVFFDAETFYSREYSLRKMSPAEYLLDERFELLAAGVAVEQEDPIFLEGEDSIRFLMSIKQPYCVISHNATFDATLLSYVYNLNPNGLLCTLSMARAMLAHAIKGGRVSLKAVLNHIGAPEKTDTLPKLIDMHLEDIKRDPTLMMEWVGYTINDVQGCRTIFNYLKPEFPGQEAMILDRVLRMTTQPKLRVDRDVLQTYYDEVVEEKAKLLAGVETLGGTKAAFMSNQQFAALLANYGIDPPMKVSPTTGKTTYAFAKTDQGLQDIANGNNIVGQALVAARLGLKTTIEESRTARFISIADHTNAMLGQPFMPMPLKYSGAHTHRLSGDWQLNIQNLGARKTKRLRTAIQAPPGYVILAIDAAQIEARLVAWICGQLDLLEMFQNGEDTYASFASDIYGRTITKADKFERFNGKTCILGLGFQMSDGKLLITLRNGAREAGLDATYELSECTQWVFKYRSRFKQIKEQWGRLDWLVAKMANGDADGQMIGPCKVEGQTILMPSGLRLFYDNLAIGPDRQYSYTFGSMRKQLYGAKLLENVVQGLDRQHVMEAAIRTERRARALDLLGYEGMGEDGRSVANIHDENVYVCREENEVTLRSIAMEEMVRPCSWGTGLPLAAEPKSGPNFGEME